MPSWLSSAAHLPGVHQTWAAPAVYEAFCSCILWCAVSVPQATACKSEVNLMVWNELGKKVKHEWVLYLHVELELFEGYVYRSQMVPPVG